MYVFVGSCTFSPLKFLCAQSFCLGSSFLLLFLSLNLGAQILDRPTHKQWGSPPSDENECVFWSHRLFSSEACDDHQKFCWNPSRSCDRRVCVIRIAPLVFLSVFALFPSTAPPRCQRFNSTPFPPIYTAACHASRIHSEPD